MINTKKIGLIFGLIVFLLMLILPSPQSIADSTYPKVFPSAWRVAAVAVLMAIWWITEALPLPATSLLPIFLYPFLNIMPSSEATSAYSNHVIYLFIGGFFLAVTMEKWNLHRRVALYTLKIVGTEPSKMIFGFMLATAFLSMWISNTACAVMMLPIAIAVISQIGGITKENIQDNSFGRTGITNFSKSLMLSIAYAASLGGVATIIGTPPNTIMVGMLDKLYGLKITFAQWMSYGVPLAVVMLMIVWFLLTQVLFPTRGLHLSGSEELVKEELDKLGPVSSQERSIIIVASTVAFLWIIKGFIKVEYVSLILSKIMNDPSVYVGSFEMINDTTIAIGGSLALFIIPSNYNKNEFLLDWKTAVKIPWDIVLLFGGGLALAGGFEYTGLSRWIGIQLTGMSNVGMVGFIFIIVFLTLFLTEFTSNTATATLLIPIVGAAAIAMNIHPFATIIATALSSSFAFMLPVATPPNAVVFGSGYLQVKDMAYAGFLINIASVIIITLSVIYVLPLIWGIDLSITPAEVFETFGTLSE